MANINLISARRADRVRLSRIAKGLTAAVVAAGALAVGAITLLSFQLLVSKGRIAEADARLMTLRPILAEIESDEAEQKALQPKLKTLLEAQKRTSRWFAIMEGLKRAVPDQTWLTNVSVERVANVPAGIKINGITVNQTRVGETMTRLTLQEDNYKKVDLRYTQASPDRERESVEFELVALMNQPELEQKGDSSSATKAN